MDLNIRQFPDEVALRLRMIAVDQRMSLRDVVIRILGEGAGSVAVSEGTKEAVNGEVRKAEAGESRDGGVQEAQVQRREVSSLRTEAIAETEGEAEFEEAEEDEAPSRPDCPSDGVTMVMNKLMRRWECPECGEWKRVK